MPEKRLLWFVQSNLQPEPLDDLIAAIEKHARLQRFTAIPFQNEPPDLPSEFFFPSGTCNIVERIRSARPETVQGPLFDYADYLENFAELCLNAGAWLGPLATFTPSPTDFPLFLRPTKDDKSFAGELWEDHASFMRWRDVVLRGTTEIPSQATVVAASPKVIDEEWRLVVVDGEIATYSRYRQGGSQQRDRPPLPQAIRTLAAEAVIRWNPARVFALDVAITPVGAKVIELGSIHSCGLYACDRVAFVRAVSTALSSKHT